MSARAVSIPIAGGASRLIHVLKNHRPHRLTNLQLILRMIDPFIVHDIADMDHAFDIVGNLDESAELLELRHRPL